MHLALLLGLADDDGECQVAIRISDRESVVRVLTLIKVEGVKN